MAAATLDRRPPRILSWANRALGRVLDRGKGPPFLRLLTVTGRRTGEPRTTPIAPVFGEDDAVWLVAAYGDTAWVHNVRAAGQLELRRGDDRVCYRARELDPGEAVPVLRAYLAKGTSLFVRRRFDVTAHSHDEAIEAEARRHPTFALTPRSRPTRPAPGTPVTTSTPSGP
jgi:deazaflavin-dependent oxidoreductase (nitroreductase family)